MSNFYSDSIITKISAFFFGKGLPNLVIWSSVAQLEKKKAYAG